MTEKLAVNPEELEMASFSVRRQILECLRNEKKPLTKDQLLDSLWLTKRKLFYHLPILEKAGMIKVGTTTKAGARRVSITRKGRQILTSIEDQEPDLSEVH